MTMLRCAVRMRPKVNHALPVRKSGDVNFSEAINPAKEPINSQKIDDVRKAKAAARLERSSSTLASSPAATVALGEYHLGRIWPGAHQAVHLGPDEQEETEDRYEERKRKERANY